jgi:hypothetical protein
MITNPKSAPENEACKNWLASLAYNARLAVFRGRRILATSRLAFVAFIGSPCTFAFSWDSSCAVKSLCRG